MICVDFSRKKDFCKMLFGTGNVNNIRTQAYLMWWEFLLFAKTYLGLKHKFRIWTSEYNSAKKLMCMIVTSEWWCWTYLILPDGTSFKKVKVLHLKVASHTFQINQPTRCNSFSSLLLDVYSYVQLNVFRASSRTSAGAQQVQ